MSVSVWNNRIELWLQVKYSILCMNNVVLLCFLFINPSFCLQFCQSIPWHTMWQTWLFLLQSAFIARHETCNFKLPKIYLVIICDSQDMMLKRTSKSVSLGTPNQVITIGMPGMPNQRSENWEWMINPARDLGPMVGWVNFGLRGHEPIFSMPMRCYF